MIGEKSMWIDFLRIEHNKFWVSVDIFQIVDFYGLFYGSLFAISGDIKDRKIHYLEILFMTIYSWSERGLRVGDRK